jgi:hypothetical protein
MRSKPCFHDLVGSSFAFKTSHPLRRYASFGDATQDATVPPWQILIEGMVEAPKVVMMPSGPRDSSLQASSLSLSCEWILTGAK